MILQTIFVYVGLFVFMFLCTWHYRMMPMGEIRLLDYRFAVYALLAFSLVFGMRYGVGTDHLSYIKVYKLFGNGLYDVASMEKGFAWLTRSMARNGIHYFVYFSCIAFIQTSLVFLAFRKHVALYPFLVFSIMIGGTWLTMMNGLRQQIAVSVIILSFFFLNRKQWYWYLLMILLATQFHRSAYIMFLVFPLAFSQREFFSDRKLQFVLFAVVLMLSSSSAVQFVINQWGHYAVFLDYGFYIDHFYEETGLFDNSIGEEKGLGFYINVLISFVLIYLSPYVKSFFAKNAYNRLYDLFFIGVLYRYAFFSSNLLQRINYYFFGLDFIWLALTILFLFYKKDELCYRYWCLALLSLIFLRFVAILYRMSENTAAFIFFWQDELFFLKPAFIM